MYIVKKDKEVELITLGEQFRKDMQDIIKERLVRKDISEVARNILIDSLCDEKEEAV